MARKFEATNRQDAWDMVNAIFPSDYEQDMDSTERAGYPIHRSNVEHYDYICDLNNRLEINLKSGNKTINIWIAEKAEPELPKRPSLETIKEAAAHQFTFEPERVQFVRVFAMGYSFESEASQAVYEAMKNGDDFDRNSIASDLVVAYCEDKCIEWGTVRVTNVTHYPKCEQSGHYVVEAIVRARAKN